MNWTCKKCGEHVSSSSTNGDTLVTKNLPCGCNYILDENRCRESGIKLPVSVSTLELKCQISEIRNAMGELSMRINENYSKMREFEKQIVHPMRDQIHVLEQRIEGLTQELQVFKSNYSDNWGRIEKLEERMDNQENFYTHQLVKSKVTAEHIGGGGDGKPKTTGMTFVQALEAMMQDKSVRRADWTNKAFYQSKYKLQTYKDDFSWEDFAATDWEIFC
jgi:hypothetical protein